MSVLQFVRPEPRQPVLTTVWISPYVAAQGEEVYRCGEWATVKDGARVYTGRVPQRVAL